MHTPQQTAESRVDVDALVCLHGVGGNFYGSTLLEKITPSLLELGIHVLWANTRGHDAMNTSIVSSKGRRQGAAYETVDDCRHDVAAWIDQLIERGHERIGLLGHSLGAIKSIYSQAMERHESVQRIVAISPPRLSYSCFVNGEHRATFFETIATAEQHVAEGRPAVLMEVTFPFPLLITASGYVDKYGREERYNILKFADKVHCPMFFTYGERELDHGEIAFAGVPEALESLSTAAPLTTTTIPNADHSYFGAYDSLAAEVANWISN